MAIMAMTAEEKHEFKLLEQEVERVRDKVDSVERKINSILTLVRGIAIGLGIGAFLFGLIKFPELLKFFTK